MSKNNFIEILERLHKKHEPLTDIKLLSKGYMEIKKKTEKELEFIKNMLTFRTYTFHEIMEMIKFKLYKFYAYKVYYKKNNEYIYNLVKRLYDMKFSDDEVNIFNIEKIKLIILNIVVMFYDK